MGKRYRDQRMGFLGVQKGEEEVCKNSARDKWRFAKDGIPGSTEVRRGSARTRLETNGHLRCRRMERHIASDSNTGKESPRPKAAGSDSWWPRGREPRRAPLSVGGILQAGTLGRVAAPSSRGIFTAQESKPSLLRWQAGSSPPEPPAKHNLKTTVGTSTPATPNPAGR